MTAAIDHDRRRLVGAAAMTVAAAKLGAIGAAMEQLACAAFRSRDEGPMPSLDGATTWLASPPLTTAGLRGKVVAVDFCTYTCINWLRSLPYVRAWDRKYRRHGLVTIGVHTPEFAFEHDVANVQRAMAAMRVEYPVAVDNDYAIWQAFRNQFWPALYLVDATGAIRHHQFGEGGYDRAERVIQQLLAEAGASGIDRDLVAADGRGVEAEADWGSLRSPEKYLGYERTESFASHGTAVRDGRGVYDAPPRLRLNEWSVAGEWTLGPHASVLERPNGRLASRFHARDLHLVMGPPAAGGAVRFRVRLDGQPPGAARGIDVDADGHGTVAEQRLYQLVRQSKPISDRQFEIEFLDAGVEAYAFTFG